MVQQAFTPWMHNDPMAQQTGGVPGSASKTYPIKGEGPEPVFRDRLDAARSARLPQAEYPSGYLGTMRTRREDRLGGSRVNRRGYQRGVHNGSRVPPQAYFWDREVVHPLSGLEAQARGHKWAPMGEYVDTHLTNDGKPMPRGAASLIDPAKEQRIPKRLHPNWK